MSKTLIHYFKKHCGKILWKYQFMFYLLQFSLPPDSKLRAKPFIFLCKLESRCFFCLWYKLKVIREMMLRGLERQRCQGVTLRALRRKGTKNFPRIQKGRRDGLRRGSHQWKRLWAEAPWYGTTVFPNNPTSKARTETAERLDMRGPLSSAWDILLENQCGPMARGTPYTQWLCLQAQDHGADSVGRASGLTDWTPHACC